MILPPVMKEGWGYLRAALIHYLRPHLQDDPGSEACMKEGAEKMARYGKWAERNNLKAEICKFNLHTAACQFYFQERDMCPPGLYKEMWVELGMQLAKSGAPTAGGDKPEPTIANLTTPFYTQIYKFSNLPIIPYSHSPFLSNYLDKPCLYQRFSDLHHTHPGIILWRRHFIQLHTFIFSTQ